MLVIIVIYKCKRFFVIATFLSLNVFGPVFFARAVEFAWLPAGTISESDSNYWHLHRKQLLVWIRWPTTTWAG